MRLRATRSRDIRAANFYELYVKGSSSFGGLINPWTNTTDFPTYNSGGNVNLKPETGDTYTIGTVLSAALGLDRRPAPIGRLLPHRAQGCDRQPASVRSRDGLLCQRPDGDLLLEDHLPQWLRQSITSGGSEQRELQSV